MIRRRKNSRFWAKASSTSASMSPALETESVKSVELFLLLRFAESASDEIETVDASCAALLHRWALSVLCLFINCSFINVFCRSFRRCWAGVLCVDCFVLFILFCLFDAAVKRFCLSFTTLCFELLDLHFSADNLMSVFVDEFTVFGMLSRRDWADLLGFDLIFGACFASLHIASISSLILAAMSLLLFVIRFLRRSCAGVLDFLTILKGAWKQNV